MCGLLLVWSCSKGSSAYGKWSRDDDAIVIELRNDKTGVITADNVKIYKKQGIALTSEVQLKQEMKCRWSLQDGNMLKIEEVDSASHNILYLKLEGNTLTKDGKIAYKKIAG